MRATLRPLLPSKKTKRHLTSSNGCQAPLNVHQLLATRQVLSCVKAGFIIFYFRKMVTHNRFVCGERAKLAEHAGTERRILLRWEWGRYWSFLIVNINKNFCTIMIWPAYINFWNILMYMIQKNYILMHVLLHFYFWIISIYRSTSIFWELRCSPLNWPWSICHSRFLSLSLPHFHPNSSKADDGPFGSGSALGFLPQRSFFFFPSPLLHLACSGDPVWFFSPTV